MGFPVAACNLWSAVLPLFWLCVCLFLRSISGNQFPSHSRHWVRSVQPDGVCHLPGVPPCLGAKPAAGTVVLSEVTEHEGSPGLTAASPKALLGNRVHWTHLFPSKLLVAFARNCLVHWARSFRFFFAALKVPSTLEYPFLRSTFPSVQKLPGTWEPVLPFGFLVSSISFLFLSIGYHNFPALSIDIILFHK